MAETVTGANGQALAVAGELRVRTITMDAPWGWLASGWRALWAAPFTSILYGFVFVGIGLCATAGLWWIGLESLVPTVVAGFGLVGPALALGLYEIARRMESGATITPNDAWRARPKSPAQFGLLAFALIFLFLIWMRAATILVAVFMDSPSPSLGEFASFVLTTPAGVALLVIGSAVGGAIAFTAFAISAVAFPLLLDRDVDALTAMGTSILTVVRNPAPMLLWAWLISILTAFGLATFFVGLVIVFPLVGYASWHAYRDLIETN